MLTQNELRSLKVGSVVGIEMHDAMTWSVSVISSFVDCKTARILITPINGDAQAYDFSVETGIEVHTSHDGKPYRLIRAEDARHHNNMTALCNKRRNLNHEVKAYISKGDVTLVGEIDFLEKKVAELRRTVEEIVVLMESGIQSGYARRNANE